MPYEMKPNTLSIWPDDSKEVFSKLTQTNSKVAPGSAVLVCPACGKKSEFWVSLFYNVTKMGKNLLSGTLKLKEDKPKQAEQGEVSQEWPY